MRIINLKYFIIYILSTIVLTQNVVEFSGDNLNIAIYNQNKAFVQESRSMVSSVFGEQTFIFTQFPESIQPSSLNIISENCLLKEMYFNYQDINEQAMLNAFIGKTVRLEHNDRMGEKTSMVATLIANNGVPVFEVNDEILVNPDLEVVFPYLPEKMVYNNSVQCVGSVINNNIMFNLNYLTGGFDWTVDYFLNLDNNDLATILAWFSIDNTLALDYINTTLSLVSGEVSFVEKTSFYAQNRLTETIKRQSTSPRVVSTKDYTVFTIPGKISIPGKSNSKHQFFPEKNITIKRSYHVERSHRNYNVTNLEPIPVTSTVIIESNEIGDFNLPNGVVHVYENNIDQKIFVGENILPLTQAGGQVIIELGKTMDITAKFTYLNFESDRKTVTYKLSGVLKNIRKYPVSLIWNEKINGEWRIIDTTDDYVKIDAQTARFKIDIPSQNEKEIIFTVKVNKN